MSKGYTLLICLLFILALKHSGLNNPPLAWCHQSVAMHLESLRVPALTSKSDSFVHMEFAIKCGAATDQVSNICNKTHLYLICCVITF